MKKKNPGSATITSRSQSELWLQEEEERDANQQVQNKQTQEKHTDQFSLP